MAKTLFQNIGQKIENFIEPVLTSLAIDGIGAFLAASIIVSALVIALIASWRFATFFRELRGAHRVLKDAKDQNAFCEHYEKIDKYFRNRKSWASCWREFYETLIFTKADEPQIIKNTVRPGEFFNTEEAGFTIPVIRILPSILIGLGLALTFAGLIAALSIAVSGMEGTPAEVQESLIELLTTTSAKFYTSLAALGSSILLSLLIKFLESRRDGAFIKLNDKLEKGLRYISPESVALEQLKNSQEQVSTLKEFSTDLAMTLGKHIREAISESMSPTTEKLEAIGQNMEQKNIDAIKEIGDAVAKNVQGAAGESLNHLSDRLDTLATALGDLPGDLKKSTSEFENYISVTMESMKKIMETLASDLQKNATASSEAMVGNIEKITENLIKAAEDINTTLSQGAGNVSSELESAINKLAKASEESAAKMGEAATGISQATEAMTSVLLENMKEGMETLTSDLQKKVTASSEAMVGDIGKITENLGKGAENINTTLSQSVGNISNELESAIDKLAKATDESTTKMSSAASSISQAVESVTSAFNDASSEASEVAKAKIEQAGDSVASDFQESGRKMKEALEGNINILASAMDAFGKNLEASEKSISELSTTLTRATGSIGRASTDIDGSVKSLTEGAAGINSVLQPALSATDRIRSATEKMNDGVAQLEAEMRTNSEMWEKHSKQFDGVNERLGAIFEKINKQIEGSQSKMSEFVTEIDNKFSSALAGLQEAIEEFGENIEELAKARKSGEDSS